MVILPTNCENQLLIESVRVKRMKMKILCVAIVLLIAALNVNAVLVDCQPQQIHIALGRECV